MSQEVYAIIDLNGYVSQIRDAAAKSLSDTYTENLDDYISLNQMINMVKKECVGFDDQDRPLLDEDTNEKIFEHTAVWIHNVGLAKLAAKDLVECAWDDQINEMVFWAKSTNNQTKEIKNDSSKPKRKRNPRKNKGS